jgi:hypothetical protein
MGTGAICAGPIMRSSIAMTAAALGKISRSWAGANILVP